MSTIVQSAITLSLPIDFCFEQTQDMNKRVSWDDEIKVIRFMPGYTALDTGARVYVENKTGVGFETEYLSFNPPHEIKIKKIGGSSLFNHFIGGWYYDAPDSESTVLTIRYEFTLSLIYKLITPVLKWYLKRLIRKKLKQIKTFLEAENKSFSPH